MASALSIDAHHKSCAVKSAKPMSRRRKVSAATAKDAFLPTNCTDCGQFFFSASKFRYHRRTAHKPNPFEACGVSDSFELLQTKLGSPVKAKCALCGKVLLAKNANSHILRHIQRFECSECGKLFRSSKDLRSHKELHQNTQVVCPECGIGFGSSAGYRSHRARKHGLTSSSGLWKLTCSSTMVGVAATATSFAGAAAGNINNNNNNNSNNTRCCPVCNKQLHKSSLRKHLTMTHAESIDAVVKNDQKVACDVCGKALSRGDSLRRHEQTHSDTRRFACTTQQCGLKFNTKRALEWHRKRTGHHQPQTVCVNDGGDCNSSNNNLEWSNSSVSQVYTSMEHFSQSMPSPLLMTEDSIDMTLLAP